MPKTNTRPRRIKAAKKFRLDAIRHGWISRWIFAPILEDGHQFQGRHGVLRAIEGKRTGVVLTPDFKVFRVDIALLRPMRTVMPVSPVPRYLLKAPLCGGRVK